MTNTTLSPMEVVNMDVNMEVVNMEDVGNPNPNENANIDPNNMENENNMENDNNILRTAQAC